MMRLALCLLALLCAAPAQAASFYAGADDPYALVRAEKISITFAPKKRPLDLRVSWPVGPKALPVIVFSHGAFGSRERYDPLVSYWVRHGYAVIQTTHSDSMKKGTLPFIRNPLVFREWHIRPEEISYVLTHLDDIAAALPDLPDMDRDRIAVAGHSYGAHTVMLLAGVTAQPKGKERRSFFDVRPKAYVMISPQGTGGIFDAQSFKTIRGPALFVTGSNDTVPGRKDVTPESRLEPFLLSAPEQKYLFFIQDAHHDFGGISGARYRGMGPKDPAAMNMVRQITLAFFDAALKNSPAARDLLENGDVGATTAGRAVLSRR